jgi:DGQHR domain-containing protein
MKTPTRIRRRALRVNQSKAHPLYLFALTAEELLLVADISRVSRDEGGKLIGYQRPEVRRHVTSIIEYLNGPEVLFPNSIIIALSSNVTFTQMRGPKVDTGMADAGTLEIRLSPKGQPRPGWIVDGQQRAIALSRSRRHDFPVPVSAFIADEVDLQRDQFLRVNNTKPLPRGLIGELLPQVSTILPANLAARKIPAALCEMLNQDQSSPFHGLISRSSTPPAKRSKAVVSDTAVIQMLQESLTSASGCLFPYRNLATGETDFAGIRRLLLCYWTGVKEAFPKAWGKPPRASRLMHSVGIRAMGRLMDRVMATVRADHPRASRLVRDELRPLQQVCRWTEGSWEGLDDLRWNELQSIPSHIRLLSSYVARTYLEHRRGLA